MELGYHQGIPQMYVHFDGLPLPLENIELSKTKVKLAHHWHEVGENFVQQRQRFSYLPSVI